MTVDPRDIIGGVALAAVGAFVFLKAFDYGIGTPRNMGAGFLPMALGGAMVIVAVIIAVGGLRRAGAMPVVAWRPMVAILAGILAFALTVRPFGLIPSTALAGLVSAAGDRSARPLPTVVFNLSTAVAIWVIFAMGLGLKVPGIKGLF